MPSEINLGSNFEVTFNEDNGTLVIEVDSDEIQADGIDLGDLNSLQLQDATADPSANGEFQRNGSDAKVYSGGSVRNLSNVGSGGGGLQDGDDFDGQGTSDFTNLNSLSTGEVNINQSVVLATVNGNLNSYPLNLFADAIDAANAAISDGAGRIWLPNIEGHNFSTTLNFDGVYGVVVTGPGKDDGNPWVYSGSGPVVEVGGLGHENALRDVAIDTSGESFLGFTSGGTPYSYEFSSVHVEDSGGSASFVNLGGGNGPFHVSWHDCNFKSGDTHIDGTALNWEFHNCRFLDPATRIADLYGRRQNTFVNCTFNGGDNQSESVRVQDSQQWALVNCNFETGSGPAIRLGTTGGDVWGGGTVLNPRFRGTNAGVVVSAGAANDTDSCKLIGEFYSSNLGSGNDIDASNLSSGYVSAEQFDQLSIVNDSDNRVVGTYTDGRTVARDPSDGAKYVAAPSANGWSSL